MLKGLRGRLATGTGGRGSILPEGVGAKVALLRAHLVQATRVKLG